MYNSHTVSQIIPMVNIWPKKNIQISLSSIIWCSACVDHYYMQNCEIQKCHWLHEQVWTTITVSKPIEEHKCEPITTPCGRLWVLHISIHYDKGLLWTPNGQKLLRENSPVVKYEDHAENEKHKHDPQRAVPPESLMFYLVRFLKDKKPSVMFYTAHDAHIFAQNLLQ